MVSLSAEKGALENKMYYYYYYRHPFVLHSLVPSYGTRVEPKSISGTANSSEPGSFPKETVLFIMSMVLPILDILW